MTTPMGMDASHVIEMMADQRISQIEEKITATSNLIEVITKFNLYEKQRQSKPISDIVDSMRKKIKLELVSTDLANPGASTHMDSGQLAAIASP